SFLRPRRPRFDGACARWSVPDIGPASSRFWQGGFQYRSSAPQIEGKTFEVGPGQAACVPRGAVHSFRNSTTQDAKVLCIITPAAIGPEYFREIGTVLKATPTERYLGCKQNLEEPVNDRFASLFALSTGNALRPAINS
ncbi:MAG: cupin domain-containing protein, partial [Silvibacterium sp.]